MISDALEATLPSHVRVEGMIALPTVTQQQGEELVTSEVRNTVQVQEDLRRGREAGRFRHRECMLSAAKATDGENDTSSELQHQSDEEVEELPTAELKRKSQRKQADNAAVDRYVRDNLRTRGDSLVLEARGLLEDRTTQALVRDADEFIISSPREYQVELFEIAKQKNVIAVLDTGESRFHCCAKKAQSISIPYLVQLRDRSQDLLSSRD